VCFWRKEFQIFYFSKFRLVQNGTRWVYGSDFVLLENACTKGSALKLEGSFSIHGLKFEEHLFQRRKVWCCSVLSVQGLHVLSSHKRVASFNFGIVLMLLPLEMGLKVQKNNAENTVYSSHVGCLPLKGQGNLFWSKCNLFGFGLNFLCLPRDPLPISKVIKTFSCS